MKRFGRNYPAGEAQCFLQRRFSNTHLKQHQCLSESFAYSRHNEPHPHRKMFGHSLPCLVGPKTAHVPGNEYLGPLKRKDTILYNWKYCHMPEDRGLQFPHQRQAMVDILITCASNQALQGPNRINSGTFVKLYGEPEMIITITSNMVTKQIWCRLA